jgi:hypothetical protein
MPASQMMPSSGLHLGQLIHTAGSLEHYQGRLQLSVKFLSLEKDSNAEPTFWLERALLQQVFYSAPPPAPPAIATRKHYCSDGSLEQPHGAAVKTEAEKALDDSIAAFAMRRKSFRYAELLDDAVVGDAARALLRARGAWQDTWPPAEAEARQCAAVRRRLMAMRAGGAVVLCDEVKDVYEAAADGRQIASACLAAVRAAQGGEGGGPPGGGVSLDEILSRVRASEPRQPPFTFMPLSQLKQALLMSSLCPIPDDFLVRNTSLM